MTDNKKLSALLGKTNLEVIRTAEKIIIKDFDTDKEIAVITSDDIEALVLYAKAQGWI